MKFVLTAAALAASLMFASDATARNPTDGDMLQQLFADERAYVYRDDPLSATYALACTIMTTPALSDAGGKRAQLRRRTSSFIHASARDRSGAALGIKSK